ncbi:MAG: hypothetical protein KDJ54_02770 [Candidatus Competibacteraceae bacterium]|nr:hypothetical protein [Candidatus Competibacteraceae bacterium]
MAFKFILIAFATLGSPPSGIAMRNTREDCFFAPLCHDGLIYTADLELWSKADVVPDGESGVFCPQKQDILFALSRAQNEDWRFLMALTEHREFDTPGLPSARLSLESASNLTKEIEAVGLIDLGFDIVDQWTGLSALANIGYSTNDVTALKKLKLKTNQFGLFDDIYDSFKFIEFATNVVPEHTPFLPLKVYCSSSILKTR